MLVCAALLTGGTIVRAHKPITSRYTYTADIHPIFRDRCGACHRPDGVAAMSLLTYDEARPWATSIKEEIMSLRMPPRYAEPSVGALKNGHALSAREIDMILDWASGGTPQGARQPTPVPPIARDWALGPPDLVLTPAEPFTLAKDAQEAAHAFVVATGVAADRWVRAIDVRPGNSSIVRSVTVHVEGGKTSGVLAVWVPGQEPVALPKDLGILLPGKSRLILRVHYKKNWQLEGQELSDRSEVALYFTARPARLVESLVLTSPGPAADDGDGEVRVSQPVPGDVEILAALPELDGPVESLRVDVVRPDGTRVPVLVLTGARPGWPLRYWLAAPLAAPKGSRVEMTATPSAGAEDRGPEARSREPGAGAWEPEAGSRGRALKNAAGGRGSVTLRLDYARARR